MLLILQTGSLRNWTTHIISGELKTTQLLWDTALKPCAMDSSTRLTVLISGNGTNLQALIDKISAEQLPATIVRVISNRKDAFGLERAKRAGIPTLYHNLLKYKKKYPSTDEGVQAAREEYDADLAKLVLQDSPELVVCLGFLHVLSRNFLDPIENAHVKIINLHPALPGAFGGSVSICLATWLLQSCHSPSLNIC